MRLILLVLVLLSLSGPGRAEKVALVIGNSAYRAVERLDNPANDAVAVAASLRENGFSVDLSMDLGRGEMRDALRRFRDRADGAEVALVYYAGHGIEIAGSNYLVPVDARLEDIRDAELEMIQLDLVLRQISGAASLKMVVLDACRNNPFVVRMQRENSGRGLGSGLGRVEAVEADTLIAYAAAAGEITPDGASGGNSPFTSAFVQAMAGPPTDVRRLLGRVRDNMRQTVPGAAPFVYTSLGGNEFVINPNGARPEPPVATAPAPAPAAVPGISEDFVVTDRSASFAAWDAFLTRHQDQSGHPLYAFALEKREALRVPGAPATAPAPSRAALDDDEAARRLQVLLRERGCYGGAIDGILGRGSRAGLDRLAQAAGLSFAGEPLGGGEALRDAIARIESSSAAACPAVSTPRRSAPASANASAGTAARPRTAPVQAAPEPALPAGSREPRRTKLLPEPGTNNSECRGNRAKFYQCD